MKNQTNEMSINGEQNLCLKFCKVCFGLSPSMGKITDIISESDNTTRIDLKY